MMISELPEDLLEEILCRVPAASLRRLRSTRKRWNSLFNDRRFTRKHFDNAAKQSLILMLKWSRECSNMKINLHRFSLEVKGAFSLTDLHSSLDQTEIRQVFHCDGLLLCVTNTELVVWNPFTRQTRWIINHHKQYATYALGSYQDKKSNDISYKILSCGDDQEFKIYEMNSDSWRVLDVAVDFRFFWDVSYGVSLKGKTYWIARDEKEGHVEKFLLVSFDYIRERFERLCLPRQYPIPSYRSVSLSVVREEKLSVLLQRDVTSKTEVWVTNKISETKGVTWSMVLAVDLWISLSTRANGSFWIDEERKVLFCCGNYLYKGKTKVCIVGEDNKAKQEYYEAGLSMPFLFNYVSSLTQI